MGLRVESPEYLIGRGLLAQEVELVDELRGADVALLAHVRILQKACQLKDLKIRDVRSGKCLSELLLIDDTLIIVVQFRHKLDNGAVNLGQDTTCGLLCAEFLVGR